STVTFHPPAIPIATTSTGDVTDLSYWLDQVRSAVRFADAVDALRVKGVTKFLEVGPDGVLSALVDGIPAMRKGRDEPLTLMTAVARAHIEGWSPDWTSLLAGGQRVDLPTYPFQRQRYWLDAGTPAPATSTVDGWLYREAWTPLPRRDAALTGTWLVVGHASEELVAALAAAGADTVTAPVREGRLREGSFAGVVALPADAADALNIVQTLGDAGVDAPLWCVTRGAATDPVQRAIWGLGRVVALEHPDRWGGLIDLADADPALLPAVLGGVEDQVMFRGGIAHGRRLIRATVTTGWTPSGTVLVTGGTGALGGHVARWLAAEGAARIVLVSRRGPEALAL
ncbi:KR domain-containing protein, partial [Dactylosporangium sp. NPDC050688]|uniref:KR domain-containing protein n=1 Tax=Dactylosporangium sp. NPDC050688 TaxID=3157217 RepID=UPI0033F64221